MPKFSVAEIELMNSDQIMKSLVHKNGPICLSGRQEYFDSLCSSIISQQISVKAAHKIFERFTARTKLDPHVVVTLDETDQKNIGLSTQKLKYLRSLADHFIDDPAVFNHLEKLDDEKIIVELTKVTGIGIWTAQMFLIFTMNRPDVFAPGDRGLQIAIERHYKKSGSDDVLTQLSLGWSPHRSVACLHLWRSLDNQPLD